MLNGHILDHGQYAICLALINLHPSMRMTFSALTLGTICREKDAKAAGMVEVWHGGTTSVGAQFRTYSLPQKVSLRSKDGAGYEERDVSLQFIAGHHSIVLSIIIQYR
jgi:hypothetical protein